MIKKVLVLIALLACVSVVNAAICTSVATGNWTDSSIWDPGVPAATGDEPYIVNGHTVTINSAISMTTPSAQLRIGNWSAGAGTLKIVSGGSLNYNQGVYMGLETHTNLLHLDGGTFGSGHGFAVGFHGTGTVTIENGGSFGIGTLQVTNGAGTVNVLDGIFRNWSTSTLLRTPTGATINLGDNGTVFLRDTVDSSNVLTDMGLGTLARVNGVAAQAEDFAFESVSFAGADWTAITVIPEPATMFLLGIGSLVLVRRRRN